MWVKKTFGSMGFSSNTLRAFASAILTLFLSACSLGGTFTKGSVFDPATTHKNSGQTNPANPMLALPKGPPAITNGPIPSSHSGMLLRPKVSIPADELKGWAQIFLFHPRGRTRVSLSSQTSASLRNQLDRDLDLTNEQTLKSDLRALLAEKRAQLQPGTMPGDQDISEIIDALIRTIRAEFNQVSAPHIECQNSNLYAAQNCHANKAINFLKDFFNRPLINMELIKAYSLLSSDTSALPAAFDAVVELNYSTLLTYTHSHQRYYNLYTMLIADIRKILQEEETLLAPHYHGHIEFIRINMEYFLTKLREARLNNQDVDIHFNQTGIATYQTFISDYENIRTEIWHEIEPTRPEGETLSSFERRTQFLAQEFLNDALSGPETEDLAARKELIDAIDHFTWHPELLTERDIERRTRQLKQIQASRVSIADLIQRHSTRVSRSMSEMLRSELEVRQKEQQELDALNSEL